jgi:uncharacterized damage-inducible protein DinB
MPGWITNAVEADSLDLSGGPKYTTERTDTLLQLFDKNVAAARAALAAANDARFAETWSLTMGGKVLFSSPKGAVVRQNLSHLAHHRGQMTVYLRLLDVPVPSVYGPTADEGWGG